MAVVKKDKINKYNGKGLSGMANLGNTCFLNSCMQVISHTYELNDFLETAEYKKNIKNIPDSVLLVEWDKLRQLLWTKNCTISPGGFVSSVQKIASIKNKDLFTGWAQNDLPEFLLFFIDSLHNALSREVDMTIRGNIHNKTDKVAKQCYEMMKNMYTREYSELINIFYGIHVSKLSSRSNEVLSTTPEPFFMLDLPIPVKRNSTIYDCFNLYTQPELLSGDNAWFNDKTKTKQDVVRNIEFWSLPNILAISLKRFTNNLSKTQTLIDFPLTDLDLCKYVCGYNKKSYKYDLYGICNHSGGISGGHYTSYIKNANGIWYHFNDTNITKVDNTREIVSPRAYCLFYRKKLNQ
jgi:ubiquitin carboxyl-terminal hydrolase 8